MLVDGGGSGGGEAAALFPYAEDDALSASPATISGLADTIEGSAGNLEALGPNVDTAHRPALTGTADVLHAVAASAPTPTKNNINQVLLATLCASGATRVFGTDGVQAYNSHVDSIRSEYYRRKGEIMSSDCGVAAASYPDGATTAEKSTIDSNRSDAVDGARTEGVAALVTELQGKQDGFIADPLNSQATTAASRLNQGPTDQVIQDIYAAGGLPYSTVAAFPALNLTLEDGNLPSDLAGMTPDELAQHLVDHPEITDPNILLNLDDETEEAIGGILAEQARALIPYPIDGEHIDALNSQLDRFGIGVDGQFIKALGGEDTLALVNIMGAWAGGESGAEARELAENMREAVGNATTMLPEADARQLANEFVDAIKEWGQNDVEDPDANRGIGLFPPHLALSYLLDDQYHGTEFLDTLGDRMDDYERNDPYFSSWGSLSHDERYDGIWENLMNSDEGAYDPMASYMSALGHNGEASLQFFTEGEDRQEYWIKERFWGHDDFEGLLSALDSATTDSANLDDPDAARLVSNAVNMLTHRDENFGGNGEDFEPGDINGAAAQSLAHMMGTYMAAVDYANHHPGADYPDDPGLTALTGRPDLAAMGLENMPIFDRDDLVELFQTGVGNDEGFIAMREAVSNYENYHLGVILDNYGEPGFEGTPGHDGMWEHATNADARLEGLLMDSIGEVEIADGKSKDEQIKAWIQLGNDLAGAIPIPGAGAAVDFLSGQALDLTTDKLEETFADNEAMARDSANEAAQDAVGARSTGIITNLHEAGVVTDADIRTAAQTAYNAAPPQGFDNFDDWYIQYFPGPGASFPDSDDVSGDPTLSAAFASIANSQLGFDTNEYQLHYENTFDPYFPE